MTDNPEVNKHTQGVIINLLRLLPLAVTMAPAFKDLWERTLKAVDGGVSDAEMQTLIAERETLEAKLQEALGE